MANELPIIISLLALLIGYIHFYIKENDIFRNQNK